MIETVSERLPAGDPAGPGDGPTGSPFAEAPEGASLRARLREETRLSHERLDASFAALGAGEIRDYPLFLTVNEACHRAIDPVLAASPLFDAMPDAGIDRGRAAVADLAAMGLRPIASEPFPIDDPSLAQSIGIAYVVEGSRLGARMILKRMRNGEGSATGGPLATFFLESAGAPERFRDFLGLAETLLVTKPDRDAAVRAAETTFGFFLEAVRRARAAEHDGG